jgi:hypothetical protein
MDFVPYVYPWAAHLLLIGLPQALANREHGSKFHYFTDLVTSSDLRHREDQVKFLQRLSENNTAVTRTATQLIFPQAFLHYTAG